MATNRYVNIVSQPTPQTEVLPGREQEMAKNNQGGYSFVIDDWERLERFLILGTEGGSFYVSEREFTLQNVAALNRYIQADPAKTAEIIARVSESGRAFKNDVAAFCVAYMASLKGAPRFAAYKVASRVLRTGRSLLEFHQNLEKLGVPSNMSRRKAYGRWMTERKASDLAYQALKYQSSGTLKFSDLVRYAHPSVGDGEQTGHVLGYLRDNGKFDVEQLPEIVHGWEAIKRATTGKEAAEIVQRYRLTWEFVPGQWQNDKDVWQALLPNLPYTALIRNLARLSSYEMLAHGSSNAKYVRDRLVDVVGLKKARIHPMTMLVAWRNYQAGGNLGHTKLTWKPTAIVRDALEEGFYLSFDAVEPSGKSMLMGLDVSGSMSSPAGSLPIMCCEVSAVMAMLSLRVERDSVAMAFDHGIRDLNLSKHDSLEAVLRKVRDINGGGTDCSLPIMHALDNGMQIDQFVVLTDSETRMGRIHPAEALKTYRKMAVPGAKMVVVGMTSTGFSIADPQDPGMLDIVGISPDVPSLISRFAAGI